LPKHALVKEVEEDPAPLKSLSTQNLTSAKKKKKYSSTRNTAKLPLKKKL
jgi:hypothetical protein